jgi:predicted nucleic acid-binding protein
MNTYIDTNILYHKYSGELSDFIIEKQTITSINALEFLKNIEKKHNNRARYHIPNVKSALHFAKFINGEGYIKKRNHPIGKSASDYVLFDFANEFESYAFYNNHSISQVINNKYNELFYLSIAFLEKSELKEIRDKYNFLISNNLFCENIDATDIELGYELLDKFLQKYSLKGNFRNCWNDILILSKCINKGSRILTGDKLLNRFACDIYEGSIRNEKDLLDIKFPDRKSAIKKNIDRESKGYINRGWFYKIRN